MSSWPGWLPQGDKNLRQNTRCVKVRTNIRLRKWKVEKEHETETPWVRVYYIYLTNEHQRRCMINQSFWHVWWRLQLLYSLLNVKMLFSSIAPSPSTLLLSLTPLGQQTGPCTVCMCVLWVIDLSWWFLCTGEMLDLVLFKYYFDYSAMIISMDVGAVGWSWICVDVIPFCVWL